MAEKKPLTMRCTLTGAATAGVQLSPGAFSAISPKAHAARERGEEVKPAKNVPPVKIPRRSAAAKKAALEAEKGRR